MYDLDDRHLGEAGCDEEIETYRRCHRFDLELHREESTLSGLDEIMLVNFNLTRIRGGRRTRWARTYFRVPC